MALQSTGAISLANIQTEFSGSNPISLSEYYRGGGYVGVYSTTLSIPSSGTISISQFYGTSNLPPLAVTSLGFSVSTSGTIVTMTPTVNLNRANDTGFTQVYSVVVQFSSDGGSNYYGLATLNITVAPGSSSGSGSTTVTQSAYWGPLTTLYARASYNSNAILSSVYSWYSQYYATGTVTGLTLSGGGGTGPGSTTFNYGISLSMVNNTGSAVSYTLSVINSDSPDLVGDSSIGISVLNGSSSGSLSTGFTRVAIGFSHYVTSYTTISGVNSGIVYWQAGY